MRSGKRNRPPATTVLSAIALAVAVVAATALPAAAQDEAVPTDLLVRVVANDAKVIGSGVGGARITVRDARTGQVLAEGVQEGGTGSTDRIVREARSRSATVYDTEGTAAFLATLELRRPTVVEVVAEGPLDYPDAARRASKTLLMMPGQDVTGEGLVLRLHGFVVQVLSPEAGAPVEAGERLQVRAHLQMMCGCPTEPGGLWDSDRYDLSARLVSDDRVLAEAPLRFAGQTSHFEAELPVPSDGRVPSDLRLEVVAADAERVNFGMDRVELDGSGG